MPPTFSIVTASMGRLDHLRQSLPEMVAQPDSEVIVVDYSCPDGTGSYVREHFPSARVVGLEGEAYFSNWNARNAGAAVAKGKVLLFCDADSVLADNATAWIADNLPRKSFGTIVGTAAQRGLSGNRLKGFQVIPAAAFRRIGGYDQVLAGYAAGGDVDLGDRLRIAGLAQFPLDPAIVASVIDHGNAQRMRHHRDPLAISYAAGLLYRAAKYYLLRLTEAPEIPLSKREALYAASRHAAKKLGSASGPLTLDIEVEVDVQSVGMPRQLGYAKGKRTVKLKVEISLEGETPELE